MQPVSLAGQGLFLFPRQNIVAIGRTPQRTGRTAIYGVVLFRYHWKKMAFLWENGIEGQLWGRFSYFRSWPGAAVAERPVLGIIIQRQLYGIKNEGTNLHSRPKAAVQKSQKQSFI
jgi:hypothetical protein